MIPKLKTTGLEGIRLPELSGGVNNTDGASAIADNQMVQAQNMIFSRGEFATRGGWKHISSLETGGRMPEGIGADTCRSQTYTIPINHYITDGEGTRKAIALYIAHNDYRKAAENQSTSHLEANIITNIICEEDLINRAYFATGEKYKHYKDYNYFYSRITAYSGKSVLTNGQGLFLLIMGRASGTTQYKFNLYELTYHQTEKSFYWEVIPEDNMYVPTVLINGKGNTYSSLPSNEATEFAPQSTWESFNLMTRKFKAYFSTDARFYTESDGSEIWRGSRSFTIPFKVARIEEKTPYPVNSLNGFVLADDLTVSFTDCDGNETEVTIERGKTEAECTMKCNGYFEDPEENIKFEIEKEVKVQIRLYSKKATLYFWQQDTNLNLTYNTRLNLPRSVANNLCIVGCTDDNGRASQIGEMSGCEWFGGSGRGLKGGTRLFLYGGRINKNRVIWSDVDNPLYFPLNNFANIGDEYDEITAAAKQGEKLILFKKNSIYYTTYVDNSTSYTTDDVINGEISDIASITAIFPITHISDDIGCDLPGTIQLCNNNLVWATTKGKVYVLKGTNEYSENNIYELSYPISRLLKNALAEHKTIKNTTGEYFYIAMNKYCHAIDYDGKYWLNLFGTIFIMDYSDSGFKYASSYNEGHRVKRNISWDIMSLDGSLKKQDTYTYHYAKQTRKNTMHYYPTVFIESDGLYLLREGVCYDFGLINGQDFIAQLFKYEENHTEDGSFSNVSDCGSGLNDTDTDGNNYSDRYSVLFKDAQSYSFESGFKTKVFNFTGSAYKKRIEHIYFTAYSTVGANIKIWANTDKGDFFIQEIDVLADSNLTAENYHIRCSIHGIRRLSLEFKFTGPVSIGEIAIKYKKL